jgi:hypothetical protein
MPIEEVLQRKWGISPDSPLAQIEIKVARLCTRMLKENIRIDSDKLQQVRLDLERELWEIKSEISEITDGKLNDLNYSQQLGEYLHDNGVPKTALVHPRRNGYHLPTWRIRELSKQGYESYLIDLVIKYREQNKLHASTSRICRYTGGQEFINVRYDSTHHKIGTITTIQPNLSTGHLDKYIIPAEGKVLINIYIKDHLVYLLANYLSSDSNSLKELYSAESSFVAIASVIYGVQYDEVTLEQRRLIKQFVFKRAIDTMLLPRVKLSALEDSGDRVGDSEESQNLINLLMSTRPSERKTYVTPYGRTFHDATLEFWIRGTLADFDKAFLVLASENLNKLTPKIITDGFFIFEADKDADYSETVESITELYMSIIPSGWIKPKVCVEIRK